MVARLRELLHASNLQRSESDTPWTSEELVGSHQIVCGSQSLAEELCREDAALIVALVNAAPALLDVAEAARTYLDERGSSSILKLELALAALEGGR